jgi:hypothetical protein
MALLRNAEPGLIRTKTGFCGFKKDFPAFRGGKSGRFAGLTGEEQV